MVVVGAERPSSVQRPGGTWPGRLRGGARPARPPRRSRRPPRPGGHGVVEPGRAVAARIDQVARDLGPLADGQRQGPHLGPCARGGRRARASLERGDPDVVGHQHRAGPDRRGAGAWGGASGDRSRARGRPPRTGRRPGGAGPAGCGRPRRPEVRRESSAHPVRRPASRRTRRAASRAAARSCGGRSPGA